MNTQAPNPDPMFQPCSKLEPTGQWLLGSFLNVLMLTLFKIFCTNNFIRLLFSNIKMNLQHVIGMSLIVDLFTIFTSRVLPNSDRTF